MKSPEVNCHQRDTKTSFSTTISGLLWSNIRCKSGAAAFTTVATCAGQLKIPLIKMYLYGLATLNTTRQHDMHTTYFDGPHKGAYGSSKTSCKYKAHNPTRNISFGVSSLASPTTLQTNTLMSACLNHNAMDMLPVLSHPVPSRSFVRHGSCTDKNILYSVPFRPVTTINVICNQRRVREVFVIKHCRRSAAVQAVSSCCISHMTHSSEPKHTSHHVASHTSSKSRNRNV